MQSIDARSEQSLPYIETLSPKEPLLTGNFLAKLPGWEKNIRFLFTGAEFRYLGAETVINGQAATIHVGHNDNENLTQLTVQTRDRSEIWRVHEDVSNIVPFYQYDVRVPLTTLAETALQHRPGTRYNDAFCLRFKENPHWTVTKYPHTPEELPIRLVGNIDQKSSRPFNFSFNELSLDTALAVMMNLKKALTNPDRKPIPFSGELYHRGREIFPPLG